MNIVEDVSLAKKTTMRIGGRARYFAEVTSQRDMEDIVVFAKEKGLPLVVLGGGSNTIFADGMIEAVVVKVVADGVVLRDDSLCHTEGSGAKRQIVPACRQAGRMCGRRIPQDDTVITVESGKILASLLNELAAQGLDLSPLTGIPGTVGGAIFGNAGQGPKGIWIGSFIQEVTFYDGERWQTFTQEECQFAYRESVFKTMANESRITNHESQYVSHDSSLKTQYPILWSTVLSVPREPASRIKEDIDRLLQKRIETQPHLRTAGSCFKGVAGTPAWQLIDRAGLRGRRVGDVQIAEKHANFLLNLGSGTFAQAKELVEEVRRSVPEKLEVEMRFIQGDGSVVYE